MGSVAVLISGVVVLPRDDWVPESRQPTPCNPGMSLTRGCRGQPAVPVIAAARNSEIAPALASFRRKLLQVVTMLTDFLSIRFDCYSNKPKYCPT